MKYEAYVTIASGMFLLTLVVLFYGEPDLHEALISNLLCVRD